MKSNATPCLLGCSLGALAFGVAAQTPAASSDTAATISGLEDG